MLVLAGDDGKRRRASDGDSGEVEVEKSSARDCIYAGMKLLGSVSRETTLYAQRLPHRFLDGQIEHEILHSLI